MDPDPLPWEADLTDAGALTPQVTERILAHHGDRGATAIDAVTEERVKRYRDFMVVVGRGDEYIVKDGRACTCKDAAYNLDPDDPTDLCWHALAVRIATAVEAVDEHDLWYSDLRELV